MRAEIFAHPRGLVNLTAAEGFERFSYFGMQSLMVLYLSHYLLNQRGLVRWSGEAGTRGDRSGHRLVYLTGTDESSRDRSRLISG